MRIKLQRQKKAYDDDKIIIIPSGANKQKYDENNVLQSIVNCTCGELCVCVCGFLYACRAEGNI